VRGARHGTRAAAPGGDPPGCHPDRALCPLAGGRTRIDQHGVDEPDAHPPGTHAQKKTLIATERDATAREQWRTEIAAIAPENLVFLDETSTQTVMTRRSGRAPRGERVIGAVPRNHGANVTCLVAISASGVHAPCVFEGALDGAFFVRWTQEWLVPTLRPGMTVVLDNLSVHKHEAARDAIEAAGCQLLFLPAYSPDFNPIEMLFAKLKTYLRGIAARTFDPLVTAIGAGLTAITTQDIAGCYRHCGYHLPAKNEHN
jgi:transposase